MPAATAAAPVRREYTCLLFSQLLAFPSSFPACTLPTLRSTDSEIQQDGWRGWQDHQDTHQFPSTKQLMASLIAQLVKNPHVTQETLG